MKHKVTDLDELISLAHHLEVSWVSDSSEQHKSLGSLLELSEDILKDLQLGLNKLHNCKQSVKYWHLIIGSWLIQFLSVLFDRYMLLNQVFDHSPEVAITLKKDSFITPRNSYEALKLSETSQYNSQILQDVARSIVGLNVGIVESKRVLSFETEPCFKGDSGLKKKLFNNFFSSITTKSSIVVSVLAFPMVVQARLGLKNNRLRPIYPYKDGIENYNQEVNNESRENLFPKVETNSHFEELCYILLPYYMPVCFLEGFEKLKKLSSRYGRSPKVIITSTEMYYRYESYMQWVSSSAEKGTKVVSMQHGGNYGVEYRCEKNFIEVNPYDIFYSWGWEWSQFNRSKDSLVKRMPSPLLYLHQLKNLARKQSVEILFVTTSKRQSVRRLDGAPNNIYSNSEYFKSQLSFYGCLDDQTQKKLRLRLYKDDLKNSYKLRWKKSFPDVRFDSHAVFVESLHNASLIVVDHLGTIWLEALSLNIPFIIYIDGDNYDYTHEFTEIIELLKSVSIFHESAQSAAVTVNSIQGRIDNWWFSVEVQKIVKHTQLLMAYSPLDSLEIWSNELKNL